MDDIKDFGTAELHRQQNIQIKNGKARVYAQLPLDLYREKSIVSDDQWAAGDRLGYLFTASNCFAVRTTNLTDERGRFLSKEGEPTPAERFELEYKEAINSVHYRMRPLIRNVCCYHDTTVHIEMLRDGLDDLVRHFGIGRIKNP